MCDLVGMIFLNRLAHTNLVTLCISGDLIGSQSLDNGQNVQFPEDIDNLRIEQCADANSRLAVLTEEETLKMIYTFRECVVLSPITSLYMLIQLFSPISVNNDFKVFTPMLGMSVNINAIVRLYFTKKF